MSKDSETPLTLSDCRCNICMDIFVEPVTLPCHHTLCNSCFQFTVEKASLCCPFCRRRVSTWARYNARKNTLINSELWAKIQKNFPEECQRRISGQDIEVKEDTCLPQILRCLSKPGELRQEYEAEITKAEAERCAREQEESKASEQYIERLLAEEEQDQRLAEEWKKQMEEQLLQDEMLARELSFSLNSSTEEHNGLSPGPSPDSCRTSKNKSSNSVDIKKYLSLTSCKILVPKLLVRKSEEENTGFSGVSSKNRFTLEKEEKMDEMPTKSLQTVSGARNTVGSYMEPTLLASDKCISTEPSFPGLDLSCPSTCKMNGLASVTYREDTETMCLFSKKGVAGYDEKKDNFTGNLNCPNHSGNAASQETLISVTSDNQQDSSIATCDQSKMGNTNEPLKLFTREIPKRKSQESPSEEAVDLIMNDKRRRTFTQIDDEEDMENIQKQIYLEQKIYERYKQEEEDRLLALKLQREVDKELKTLNRKKGSPDEYPLRPKTSQSEKESPVLRKPCKTSQTDREQRKVRRSSHNENQRPSNKLQTKSSAKGGNVLNCVINSSGSKSSELLPNKQKTILQMFKRPATN